MLESFLPDTLKAMLNNHGLSRQELLGLLKKAPINKYSPTVQLVERCVQILKDTIVTSDYNTKWSWEDISTQTCNGKYNTIQGSFL